MAEHNPLSMKEELKLRRLAADFVARVCRGEIPFAEAMERISLRKQHEPAQPVSRNQLENRVVRIGKVFTMDLKLPTGITEEALEEAGERGFGLYYIPSAKEMTRQNLLRALEEEGHWTGNGSGPDFPAGDVREEGYWLWVEAVSYCPRANSTLTELEEEGVDLLSFDEYLAMVAIRRAIAGELPDTETRCRLRTRTEAGNPVIVCMDGGRLSVETGGSPDSRIQNVGGRAKCSV